MMQLLYNSLMKLVCLRGYKMKVRLITDGEYGDMENLDFSTVFDAVPKVKYGITIDGDAIENAGGRRFAGHAWTFYTHEYEIVET